MVILILIFIYIGIGIIAVTGVYKDASIEERGSKTYRLGLVMGACLWGVFLLHDGIYSLVKKVFKWEA